MFPKAFEVKIVDRGEMPAGAFMANPYNASVLTQIQRNALVESIDVFGQVKSVLINQRSGHLIDGHKRVTMALGVGDETMVSYEAIDVDDQTERDILAVLDPIGKLSQFDQPALQEQLANVSTDNPVFAELLSNLNAFKNKMDDDSDGDSPDDDEDGEDSPSKRTCPHCGKDI
jgi:hypothetical protein